MEEVAVLYIETPRYLKLIQELPELDLIDAALRLRILYGSHKLDKLRELFPTESDRNIKQIENRVDKLIQNTIESLQEHRLEIDQASDLFCDETRKRFPEFSKSIISLYLSWSGSSYIASAINQNREFTDQLYNVGEYDAEAAFLYQRAIPSKFKVQHSHTAVPSRTTLTDLFPPMENTENKHAQVLRRVEELFQYCIASRDKRRNLEQRAYDEKCDAIKVANPGFSEESYSESLHHAFHCLR